MIAQFGERKSQVLVQTNSGDVFVLFAVRNDWNAIGGLNVHLFQNDYSPLEDADRTSPFVECSFPGYAMKVAGPWSGPTAVVAIPEITAGSVTWTRVAGSASPQSAIGYWVERPDATGTVIFAERFASAVDMSDAGDALVLFMRYTQDTFFHGP